MVGINETKRLIDILENGGLDLLTINFDQVVEELKDLDWEENKELGIRLLDLMITIISNLTFAKNPVFSVFLPIASKIVKTLA